MTKSVNTVFYKMGIDSRAAERRRRRAPGRHPGDRAAQPRRRHLAGRQGGPPDRHGVGLRDVRGRRGPPRRPTWWRRSTAADGRVLYDRGTTPGEQAVPQQVARNVTESMIDVADAPAIALAAAGRVAAKTGTAQPGRTGRTRTPGWSATPRRCRRPCGSAPTSSDPIRNAHGRPVFGPHAARADLAGVHERRAERHPDEQFSPFEPIGTPPAPRQDTDGGGSSYDGTPSDERQGTTRVRRDSSDSDSVGRHNGDQEPGRQAGHRTSESAATIPDDSDDSSRRRSRVPGRGESWSAHVSRRVGAAAASGRARRRVSRPRTDATGLVGRVSPAGPSRSRSPPAGWSAARSAARAGRAQHLLDPAARAAARSP